MNRPSSRLPQTYPSRWGQADRNLVIGHVVDAQPDIPDNRDYLFQPRLEFLQQEILPQDLKWLSTERVRDQGDNPSCTGHAMAALIDHFRARALGLCEHDPAFSEPWASARMLYNIARFHDEFIGEDYGGSSCRGALKGFFYNGVCSEAEEREIIGEGDSGWFMTREILESARLVQLGAYYRVRPRLADMHAAIQEAGGVLVSASIHTGWNQLFDGTYEIPHERYEKQVIARHAFILVGYDNAGFWVQNSWGKAWGWRGLARWSYEDWAENVDDAWVFRLSVTYPDNVLGRRRIQRAYGAQRSASQDGEFGLSPSAAPSRLSMLGHLIPLRDGKIDELGHYNHNLATLRHTFEIIRDRPSKPPSQKGHYQHVVMHFLGEYQHDTTVAAKIEPLLQVYKDNNIYPLFFLWEAELAGEINRLVEREISDVVARTGQGVSDRIDVRDRLIEGRLGAVGGRLAREYLRSARRTFSVLQRNSRGTSYTVQDAEGMTLINEMFQVLDQRHKQDALSYHIIAHGTGAILAAAFLENLNRVQTKFQLSSVSFVSPCLTLNQLQTKVLPLLPHRNDGKVSRRARLERSFVNRFDLYILQRGALKRDRFCDEYSNSWLDLWSRVIGIMESREYPDSENIDWHVGGSQIKGEKREPVFRFVWLPEVAKMLEKETRRSNFQVHDWPKILDETDATPKHEHLAFDYELLDRIMADAILEDEPSNRFTTAFRARRKRR